MDDDPQPLADYVSKINEATRKDTMLVSNELEPPSGTLFEESF
jgi:hypothetical protein